jgi:hypothetical protein
VALLALDDNEFAYFLMLLDLSLDEGSTAALADQF